MPRTAKFNPAELAEYGRTHTWQQAAQHFGCSQSTFRNACAQYDVEPPTATGNRRKAITEWMRENDATVEQACAEFETTTNIVWDACRAMGVRPRKAPADAPVSLGNFEILAFLLEGWSQADIATEMCVSRQRVEQIQKRAIKARLFGKRSIIQLKPGVNGK